MLAESILTLIVALAIGGAIQLAILYLVVRGAMLSALRQDRINASQSDRGSSNRGKWSIS